MTPTISTDTRVVFWVIATVATVLAGLIGNVIAPNVAYYLSRRGRPPTQRPARVWITFCASSIILVAFGAMAAFLPPQPIIGTPSGTITPASNHEIEYIGRIIDSESQKVISNAKVTLALQGIPSIVYTDSEGVYHFKVENETTLNGLVRVEALGYQIYTRNITLISNAGEIEDIRLIPDKQSQATKTSTPTDTAVSAGVSTFIGYNFEIGIQGWSTSEGAYKRAILDTTTQVVYRGKHALVLDTELYGNGSQEFTNHNKEDVYRHTEALVYFNQIPEGINYPGPYDLTGKRLSCFVYLPVGLIVPDNSASAYVRLTLKDKNFANQFSEAQMINDKTTERWLELIYVVHPDPNSAFDTTQVNAMGVRLDSLDGSTINYKGPIYIDYCTIGLDE